MFNFLKLKENFKVLKSYEQLINKNFLNITKFNLKQIKERIDDCNNIFIENFLFLNEYKFEEHKLISNSFLLFNELKEKANLKTNEYINFNYEDSNILNNKNILLLNNPTYAKKICLNIKNFYIDKPYYFIINIEGLNDNNEFVKIRKNIFPINYAGKYIEKLIYQQDNKSIFQISKDKIKFIDEIDNVEKKINYNINNSYIEIKKEDLFNEQTLLSYEPNHDSLYIDTNIKITKIYINTNFIGNNLKKINFIKE